MLPRLLTRVPLRPLMRAASAATPKDSFERETAQHQSSPDTPLSAPKPLSPDVLSQQMRSALRSAPETAIGLFEELVDHSDVTLSSFHSLIQAHGRTGDTETAMRVLDKIRDAGLTPTTFTYNTLLKHCLDANDTRRASQVEQLLRSSGVDLNQATYEQLLRLCLVGRNMRNVRDLEAEMEAAGIETSTGSIPLLARMYLLQGNVVGCETMLRRATEKGLELPPGVFLQLFQHSVAGDLPHTAAFALDQIVRMGIPLDQGGLTLALAAGVRWSNSEFVDRVRNVLQHSGHALSQPALLLLTVAKIRACVKNETPELVQDIASMIVALCSQGELSRLAIESISKRMAESASLIDQVYYGICKRRDGGEPVSQTALNVILAACAERGALDNAFATFVEFGSFGVSPDIHAYNNLIHTCVKARQHHTLKRVFEELKAKDLEPNEKTLQLMFVAHVGERDFAGALRMFDELERIRGSVPMRAFNRVVGFLKKQGKTGEVARLLAYVRERGYWVE